MGVCSFVCWAWVCIFYFFFALIFLTVLGIFCQQDSFLSALEDRTVRKKAALPLFLAVVIYAGWASVSAVFLYFHSKKTQRRADENVNPLAARQRRVSGAAPQLEVGHNKDIAADPVADTADVARQESAHRPSR